MEDIFSTEKLTEELLKIENTLTKLGIVLERMEKTMTQIVAKLSPEDDML